MSEQQEEEFQSRRPNLREDPVVSRARRRLELGRIDLVRRIEAVQPGAHRKMLEQSLAALDQQLAELPAERPD